MDIKVKKKRSFFHMNLDSLRISSQSKAVLFSTIIITIFSLSAPSYAESIFYIYDKWDVTFIQDIFIRGDSVILCAETDKKKTYMIDIFSGNSHALNNNKCEMPKNYGIFQPNLLKNYDPMNNGISINSKETQVFLYNPNPNRCELNFSNSYKVFYRDGTNAEFVLVGRVKKPRLYHLRTECENANGVEKNIYQDVIELNPLLYTPISGHSIMLYGLDSALRRKFIIVLNGAPSKPVSLDGFNFLIPLDVFNNIMTSAGYDVQKRQEVLSKFIASIPSQVK